MPRVRRIGLLLGALAVLVAAGTTLPLDEHILARGSIPPLLAAHLEWAVARPGATELESIPVILLSGSTVLRPETTPAALRIAIEGELAAFLERHGKTITWIETPGAPPPLSIVFHAARDTTRSVAIWRPPGAPAERSERVARHARRSALLPPLIAVALALGTGRLLLALGAGAAIGVLQIGLSRFIADYCGEGGVADPGVRDLLLAIALAAAMAGVVARSGGFAGLGAALAGRARGDRGAQSAAALLGIVLFFDAVTSALVTGLAMRPLTDRCRIAREKLAYIADATAAPVATLALAPMFGAKPQLLFYTWFGLAVLVATIILGRELGPMRVAMQRAAMGGGVLRPGAMPLASAIEDPPLAATTPWLASPWRALNALVPLAVLVGVAATANGPGPKAGEWPAGAARGLFLGAAVAWGTAALLALVQALLGPRVILAASLGALPGALRAIAVLVLAWVVGVTARDLGAVDVLCAALPVASPGVLMVPLLFVGAGVIAFALGGVGSTLALVLPLAAAVADSAAVAPALAVAAVLQGAVAGTHLSPLAPSAIAASAGSASDHLDHVRTQLPYGLLAFGAAMLLGFAPVALGVPPALALAAGSIAIVAFVRIAGRRHHAC